MVQALRELGGSATRPEATQRVIKNEGVTPEEFSITRGKNRQGKIQSEIDFARNTLAFSGVIDRSVPGKWTLTDYGKTVNLTEDLVEEMIRTERETNRKEREARKKREKEAEGHSLGNEGIETIRYWLYAPGEDARMWAEFYERGVMGLGWDELGDLSIYDSKQEIRDRLREIHGSDSSFVNSALATWQFVHELKPGDVIFAKRGMSEIIGRGVVEGDYEYDPEGGEYPHLRSVKWTDKGSWKSDSPLAMKTLTEVTDYTDFVTKTKELF